MCIRDSGDGEKGGLLNVGVGHGVLAIDIHRIVLKLEAEGEGIAGAAAAAGDDLGDGQAADIAGVGDGDIHRGRFGRAVFNLDGAGLRRDRGDEAPVS